VKRTVSDQRIQVTDQEKTVLDAADRPDLCGGIWQLAQALRAHWSELDWSRLDDYLACFASGALYKRLGYLVEGLDLPIPERRGRLAGWQARLTAGIAILDPSEVADGVARRRWRVRDNIGLVPNRGEQQR
jgi:predicted transcriptional regulator of viral defense system